MSACWAPGTRESPATSGVLIATRRMNGVSIDAEARTATIGAGAQWGAVIAAAAEHGLAPITGSSPGVGAVGYLLGGGLGPLSRSHGFSSDYLVGFTVVTGSGELVEASAEQHPDLFWALRGGKDGLGVVTEVRVRLVELSALYAGSLFFDTADIETALRAWVDWTTTADPLVTTSVAIIRFPPLDVVPDPLRGRHLLSLRFAYPGSIDDGDALAAPLRSAAPVYLDALGELPASQVARIHNDPTDPTPGWVNAMLLSHIDQGFASALLDHVGAGVDSPFVATEVRHLGEATRRDVPGGSAVGGRSAAFTLGFIGVDPAQFETVLPEQADRINQALRPWIAAETNINFAGKLRSAQHYASAWPVDTFARLADVRRRYDPDGVLAHGFGDDQWCLARCEAACLAPPVPDSGEVKRVVLAEPGTAPPSQAPGRPHLEVDDDVRDRQREAPARPLDDAPLEPGRAAIRARRHEHVLGLEDPQRVVDGEHRIGVGDVALGVEPELAQRRKRASQAFLGGDHPAGQVGRPRAHARDDDRAHHEHRGARGHQPAHGRHQQLVAHERLVRDHEQPVDAAGARRRGGRRHIGGKGGGRGHGALLWSASRVDACDHGCGHG